MSSEKDWKRLIFRWTAPEGAAAMALFFTLTIFIEYLAICFFRSYGLADTQTFQLPLTIFTVTISPLFHLIPLGVIVVLASSWTYLTRYIAKVPRGKPPAKKPSVRRGKSIRRVKKKRFKAIRSFSREVSRKFRKVTLALKAFYHRIRARVLGIRGVSPVIQRLFFARAAIKGTATVVLIFLMSFLILNLMGYPSLIHDLVVGLYRGNPSLHRFVIKTINIAGSIGQALSPIGWLASGINNVLLSAAPSFRSALESFISITEPLVELDLMWRYVVCQNVAAWVSAIAVLAYGQYTPRFYRRRRR